MRLTKVRVTKLFGLFDHEIPLNREERITIIHGPNGFGKTIVLRMIAALVSGQYLVFREVPFETFAIEFDDGKRLVVGFAEKPARQGVGRQGAALRINLVAPGAKVLSYLPDVSASAFEISHARNDWAASALFRRYWHTLVSEPQGQISLWEEAPEQQSNEDADKKLDPEWLVNIRAALPAVRLIRTQRLDVLERDQRERLDAPRLTVEAYSKDLSGRIRKTLAEYAARSQELDHTFPTRLFGQSKSEVPDAEELRKRLADLEEKRSTLTKLGFLEPEQGLAQAPVQAIEAKKDVLSVYVDDVESKLGIFDEMASKIQLFTRIINERFLFKHLEIHREKGFVFTSKTGAHLKPSNLSSGEQHELILLYELLFKLRKNALVLIDEPEISLHVAWQEKFLGDLMEVVKLSEIDVVVATHSPEIIGEHWGLTVELKGPSEIRKD